MEQNYNAVDEVYLGGSKEFKSNFTKTNPPDETQILDILREVNSCENLETSKIDQWLNTRMKQVDGDVQEDDDDQEDDVKMTPLHFLAEIEEKTMLTSNNVQSRRKKQRKQIRNIVNMNGENDGFKTILASTLKMNLITFVLLVFIAPRHLLAIYYKSCYLTTGGVTYFSSSFSRYHSFRFWSHLFFQCFYTSG